MTAQDAPLSNNDEHSGVATAQEVEEARLRSVFGRPEQRGPEDYPRLTSISTAMLFERTLRATEPVRPEYVTVPLGPRTFRDEETLKLELAIAEWNTMWEAAQYRRRAMDEESLPEQLYRIADQGDNSIVFIPRTASRYYEYAPLFHLLPASTLARHGLPQLATGQWPFSMRAGADLDSYLPTDFENRLSKAWASAVWRHLLPGSPMRGFSANDPIRLLSHNLDFWVPAVTDVIQRDLRTFPLVNKGPEGEERTAVLEDGTVIPDLVVGRPRMGGDVWRGEEEAAWVVREVVDQADETGRLRGILEAVRSNRAVDDFSSVWSYEKEDFERKLYRKRAKIKVTFVELPDTIPVQGPESHVVGNMVADDFIALLKPKEREIAVLLTSGVTKLTEVAEILGYANHSPVSKRLSRIRQQAAAFFDVAD